MKEETITNEELVRMTKENNEDSITLTRDEYDAIAKFVGFKNRFEKMV